MHTISGDHFQGLLNRCVHGPCQADFIVDEATAVPYLIDINPACGSLT
jgi:hypothetical protein